MDYSKLLVLSLGTGSPNKDVQFKVGDGKQWGFVSWLCDSDGRMPFIDIIFNAIDDMVDIYMSIFFKSSAVHDNYLHIQTDSLKYSEYDTDNSKKENLENLARIGIDLLKQPASGLNLDTGLPRDCQMRESVAASVICLSLCLINEVIMVFMDPADTLAKVSRLL
ncbi:hypothetical protein Ddye_025705 [Dipteronia dyeriana]|uniref:Uncharacterized protein n=1 Tax=Dipteronia dyeriana TaxID=168575 RepID=A0AAD9TKS9_9ROSI|nr:hypothetical protein Ddye_025705 [Dipteronia dyeriana]